MAFPAPEDYKDWREYARALVSVLADASTDPSVVGYTDRQPLPPPVVIPPPSPTFPPEGFFPVWYSQAEAEMYLGNIAFTPPPGSALFNVDTAQLADAAISTAKLQGLAVNSSKLADLAVDAAKLADSAVTSTKIANLAVGSAAIQQLAVGTAHIADAAILAAKIGDLQVVTAKIADLAVNNAKIANLAVTSAKIANLAVGTAHIQDLGVTNAKIADATILSAKIRDGEIINAKIGDTIQSNTYNPTTKAGWLIDKNGAISGQTINIYDGGGNLVFGAGGSIDWSRVVGFGRPQDLATVGAQLGVNVVDQSGALQGDAALKNAAITIDGLGRLLGMGTPGYYVNNQVLSLQGTGTGQLGLVNAGALQDTVNLADAGVAAFAYLNTLTAGNASTYIANGALGTAQIGFAAITTALIADAAIISAKIAFAAVGQAHIQNAAIGYAQIQDAAVGNAKIQDAAISYAKIGDLQVGTAKIGYGAVDNARIGDLQVNSAKIADLTVGTQKIEYLATSTVGTFIGGEFGRCITAVGQWNVLINAYNGVYAILTVYSNTPNQQVLVKVDMAIQNAVANQSPLGTFGVMRHDGVWLTQQLPATFIGGKLSYNMTFVDPSPIANSNNSYYLQIYTHAFPNPAYYYNVTMTAHLVKR